MLRSNVATQRLARNGYCKTTPGDKGYGSAVFKSTAAPLTSAIHAAVIFCFLLVVVIGSHSDIPKPCPLGVLDIFDSICESEFGPIM